VDWKNLAEKQDKPGRTSLAEGQDKTRQTRQRDRIDSTERQGRPDREKEQTCGRETGQIMAERQ
jgi:hypothetical protein